MKKIILTLFAAVLSLTTYAFDFTGKTFRAHYDVDNVGSLIVTVSFRANHTATMTMELVGNPTNTDSNVRWEINNNQLVLTDSTGDDAYCNFKEQPDGTVVISMPVGDGKPDFIFHQELNP